MIVSDNIDDIHDRKGIFEPGKDIPILMDVDVAVVGGGVAGIAAAIAAAREGAKTVLIERDGCLGGSATVGMMCVFQGADFSVVRGIFYELVKRLKELGWNHPVHPNSDPRWAWG